MLVRIGEPINLDAWCLAHSTENAALLTKEIDARLRRVTLNFATAERARRAVRIARALAAITNGPTILSTSSTFASEAELVARVEAATEALEHSSPALGAAADVFASRLEALEARLAERGIALAELRVSLRLRHGAPFVAREGLLVAMALPVAALGRVTHGPPIWVARSIALRSLRTDPSRDQPAMRTMVIGLVALVAWYALQAVLGTLWVGSIPTALWLVAIFLAANVDLRLHDRLTRVRQRARTFVALRADPVFRAGVLREIDSLLADAYALEQTLTQSPPPEISL